MDGAAYLKEVRHRFQQYQMLGEKAMAQVPADADFDLMFERDVEQHRDSRAAPLGQLQVAVSRFPDDRRGEA